MTPQNSLDQTRPVSRKQPEHERWTESVLRWTDHVKFGRSRKIRAEFRSSVYFRPSKFFVNSPAPGFFLVDEVIIDGVSMFTEAIDSFAFRPIVNMWQYLNLPTFMPTTHVLIKGRTTRLVPPGFHKGSSFPLVFLFQGLGVESPTPSIAV
jgi:hypothetical protein